MRSFSRVIRGWLALCLLVACASCGINRGVYSCISASLDQCFDYGEVDQLPASTRCGLTTDGSLQTNACPATNRVGSCALSEETVRYYTPTYDGTSSQTDCIGRGGTFTLN